MTRLTEKTLRLAALSWITFLPISTSLAQESTDPEASVARQFTVEVIVFRYADSVSAGTEVFVPDPLPTPIETDDEFADEDDVRVFGDATTGAGAVPIDASGSPVEPGGDGNQIILDADGNPVILDADGNPVELDADGNPIIPLPPRADFLLFLDDELTMLSTWDRLDRLDAYEPLAHFGWHQQVAPFDEPVGIPFAEFGHAVAGLDGEFTLYLSRFLHLAVALQMNANPDVAESAEPLAPSFSDERYLEPIPEDTFAMPEGPTFYRIDEDRIFKSGDLRYFDHPRFGVIARIDRFETPQDEPAEAPEPAGSAVEGR